MFNTEVDENVPEEAQVPAEAVASAGEEIPGEDVDEGVVNDSEGLPGELRPLWEIGRASCRERV